MNAEQGAGLTIENVQDFPRPPCLEAVPQLLWIELGGGVVAETRKAFRILETHHAPTYYFPPDDIFAELMPIGGRTFCEWKGVARYFDVRLGDTLAEAAAWTYDKPGSSFADLAGYVAFYATKMDNCYVGGVRALPQPGDFYGGWVTPNLTGMVKGAPGTRHW